MTLQVMGEFGVLGERERENTFVVKAGQRYRGRRYRVEGDVSSASYFFLAAAVCEGEVMVRGINRESRRGIWGSLIFSKMQAAGSQ